METASLQIDRISLASGAFQSGIRCKIWGYDRERNLSTESDLDHCKETAAVDPRRLASKQGISGSAAENQMI